MRLAEARGDVEIAVVVNDEDGSFTLAMAAQLERGTMVVRGALQGVPPQVTNLLVATGKPRLDPSHTAGFAILNVAPTLASVPVPAVPLVPGVTFADLAATIRDPQTIAIEPGAIAFDVRVPLSNPAPAQKVIEQCTALPILQDLGATVKSGVCYLPIPPLLTSIDVWVENQQLRIGTSGKRLSAPTLAPSPVATELMQGEWAYAIYGRGTLFGASQLPVLRYAEMDEEAALGISFLNLLNELGIGVRADGDTIRFFASLRTAWANPDDVFAKLIAIPPEDVLTGNADARAKEIATAAPSSPFAGDLEAGFGGLMIPAAAIGLVAAIAVPAFMDYTNKSKQTEASRSRTPSQALSARTAR